MRPRRPLRSALLLAVVAATVVAACEAGPAPTPTPSPDPSLGPIIETDSEVCEALDVVESEHAILRSIRLRPTNRRELDDQYDQLRIAWQDLLAVVPRGLDAQLDALRWAVIDLGIAIEDYTTTSRYNEAAEHVLREDVAFARTLGRLRARTTCPDWEPTPRPQRTPTPAPSASAGPSTSPGVSASAGPSTGPGS